MSEIKKCEKCNVDYQHALGQTEFADGEKVVIPAWACPVCEASQCPRTTREFEQWMQELAALNYARMLQAIAMAGTTFGKREDDDDGKNKPN